jgi:hypothetical protein
MRNIMSKPVNKLSLQVFEVLQRCSGKSLAEQVEVLKTWPYQAVAQVLQLHFGDFQFLLPPTPPPGLTLSPEESHPTNMHKLVNVSGGLARFVYGVAKEPENLHEQQRLEARYIELLGGVHPKDAEMVLALVAGRFGELYQISQEAAHIAYPAFIAKPEDATKVETFGTPEVLPKVGTEVTTLEFRPEMEATTATLPATEDDGVSIHLLENADFPGLVLDDYSGPVKLSGDVVAEYDFSNLNQHSFEELRRAVMRENHKRKQEAK